MKQFKMKTMRMSRMVQRLVAFVLVAVLLVCSNGCMNLYLLSEQIDPNGTLFGDHAEETVAPMSTATPQPTAASDPTPSPTPYVSIIQNDAGVKFSDMVYTRPDTDALRASIEALQADFDAGESNAETLLSRYAEIVDAYDAAEAQMSLAYVLYSFDVTQEHYQSEYNDLVVELTDLDVVLTDLSIALFDDARTADAMQRTYGDDFIRTVREGRELNSSRIREYVEREQELVSEYDALRTTYVYRKDGKTYTMEDIAAVADTDYEEYARLYDAYYAGFNKQAGKIFLKLVKVRNSIAETLGFETYTEYMYRCYGRDYTPAEAKQLHEAVKTYIVPEYFDDLLSFHYDDGFEMLDTISLSFDGFVAKLKEELKEVSPQALEALEYMLKNELYTATVSENKMASDYTTYLGAYDSPFLFTQWTDDVYSAGTIMHELGHFTRFCIEPADSWSVTDPLDILEIDSQGLEMLLIHEYDDFYGKAADAAEKNHLLDGMYALIAGCMEDEFQQAVYADPDMDLEEMNALYKQLADEYGMVALYGYTGTEWAMIPHTFQSPLYYISYAVSVIPALELWAMAQWNEELAAETYLKLLQRPVYAELRELMADVGLSDPLSESTVLALTKAMEKAFQ